MILPDGCLPMEFTEITFIILQKSTETSMYLNLSHLTVNPRNRVGHELIVDEACSAELAISYAQRD